MEYHVIAVRVNKKTGERIGDHRTYLTCYPMPEAEAMTFKSKWGPDRRTVDGRWTLDYRLEPVGPLTDDFQAIVDACSERDSKSAIRVRDEALTLLDLDNDEGDLCALVRKLVERAARHGRRFQAEAATLTYDELLADDPDIGENLTEWASTAYVGNEVRAFTGATIRRVR